MKKVAVVYWSGTGNTLQMANAVADGVRAARAVADVLTPGEFTADMLNDYHAFAFGARPWGASSWRKRSLPPCLRRFCPAFPGVRSRFSALTAGATASGCAAGKWRAPMQARYLPAPVSSAVKRRMRRPLPLAMHLAARWGRDLLSPAEILFKTCHLFSDSFAV